MVRANKASKTPCRLISKSPDASGKKTPDGLRQANEKYKDTRPATSSTSRAAQDVGPIFFGELKSAESAMNQCATSKIEVCRLSGASSDSMTEKQEN